MFGDELCLIKQNLRKAGLPTKGVLIQAFGDRSIKDQKQWKEIKEKARKRTKELADAFPFAFGVYQQEKYSRDYIQGLVAH